MCRIEKGNLTEHSKIIKSLENQTEDLKKKKILKEIRDVNNESNIVNNNIDNTWKSVKAIQGSNVNNKDSMKRFSSSDVRKLQINNRMNIDISKYNNGFNNNIYDNVAIRKRRPTKVINQFLGINLLRVSGQRKNLIPGYFKCIEAVRFGRKAKKCQKNPKH